jgi:pteridine reductase
MPLALVTGAGIRVGRAIALALADAGYDLVLHVNASTGPAVEVAEAIERKGQKAHIEAADFSDHAAVQDLARRVDDVFGGLDLLVNNAAIYEREPFGFIDRAAYDRMMDINLAAPFFLTQGLLKSLQMTPDPQVINICDIAGDRPISRYAHYSLSKAGLIMLTRALAVELGPRIRVNGVSPGAILFPDDFDEALKAEIIDRVPLKREGSAEDIARAVVYLARDASYTSGQILNVDGGRSARF